MDTNVFINGREACSKATDGKSTAAFPDPCWSPPTPPAGPIVIPYPNTAFASDLCNGTTTVFICNSMVAQKDRSYFSTSQGDEGATQGLQKGVASQVIKGKAYFKSWSGNVKFEGLEVPRHQDLMTHNHGSTANTPPHKYIDSKKAKNECKKNIDKMEKACKKDPNDKSMLERILGKDKYKKLEPLLKKTGAKSAEWMTHCDGLWIKPGSIDKDEIKDKLQELGDGIKNGLDGEIDIVIDMIKGDIIDNALDAGVDIAARKGRNAAIRHSAALGGAVVGGVGAFVAEIGAAIWTVGDAIAGVVEGGMEAYEAYDLLSSAKDEIKKLSKELERIADDAVNNPEKAMTDMMSIISRLNSCTRAKKCILVPYNKAGDLGGEGCCPGQTGHHVMPGAMFYDNSNCPGYHDSKSEKHKQAPTICVEGTSNIPDWGSHGKLHGNLGDKIDGYKKPGFFKFGDRNKISYEDARKMVISSVIEVFPESLCNPKCLQAQLDAYYEKMCSPKTLNANSGKGGPNQARPFPLDVNTK